MAQIQKKIALRSELTKSAPRMKLSEHEYLVNNQADHQVRVVKALNNFNEAMAAAVSSGLEVVIEGSGDYGSSTSYAKILGIQFRTKVKVL